MDDSVYRPYPGAPSDAQQSFTARPHRWGTHSAKWDLLASPLGSDAISLSVADMEFYSAPTVIHAITRAAAHGVYGYTEVFTDFAQAACRWQRVRHQWEPRPEETHFFPRIVQCLSALLDRVIAPKNGERPVLVTLAPAYGPLLEVAHRLGVRIREVPINTHADPDTRLLHHGLNLNLLGDAMKGADVLLWCNPHNPTGRVWTRDELHAVATLALTHDVLVFSDDIHADFTRTERTSYTPLALVSPELWERELLIHCASPGKTFNTAGLESAAIFAPPALGQALEEAKRAAGLHNPNYFAIPATIAAWTDGDKWVDTLRQRIDANLLLAVDLLRTLLPAAHITDPDGTYLVWVDAAAYLPHADTLTAVMDEARVAVSPGIDFGSEYGSYFRVNVALPPADLEDALERFCYRLNTHATSPITPTFSSSTEHPA